MRLPSAVSVRQGLAVQVNLPIDRTGLTGIYLEHVENNVINEEIGTHYAPPSDVHLRDNLGELTLKVDCCERLNQKCFRKLHVVYTMAESRNQEARLSNKAQHMFSQ